MSIILKRLASIFTIICLGILLISCSSQDINSSNNKEAFQTAAKSNNQNTLENKEELQAEKTTKNNDKLTLDDVKSKYTGGENGQIVNVTTYNQFALIEYINSANLHCYDWYNLKTGDKDILPIYGNNAKLEGIKNENDIWFTTDGVCTLNGHRYFPAIIRCYRAQEVTGYDGDFHMLINNLYMKIDQQFNMGVKSNETIADIKVSLKGVEVLFEPMKGKEDTFYAAYTTVPPTKTSYDIAKNRFIIEFQNTNIDKAYNKSKINEQNRYLSSIDIKRDGLNTILTINLKDTAKYYTIDFTHLEPGIDDFPCLQFNFAKEYKVN